MAIVKLKPTSAGRRAQVKVVNPDLYKGRPVASLVEKQSKNAGRNNNGRITVRHQGGGHRRSSVSSTTRTVRRTSHCCATPMASVVTSSLRVALRSVSSC